MPRHAANEIKQAGIGKRLSGGPSGSSAKSMRSAMHNISASAPTLTINRLWDAPSDERSPQPSKGVGATNNCNIEDSFVRRPIGLNVVNSIIKKLRQSCGSDEIAGGNALP